LNNSSTFRNQSEGTLVNNGALDTTAGILTNSGVLTGVGMHVGDLYDSGVLSPGESSGVYTIDGAWNKTGGSLLIELGRLSDGGGDKSLSEYDWVDISQDINFSGSTAVELSFLPAFGVDNLTVGDRFDIVRFDGLITGFDNLALNVSGRASSGGVGWALSRDTQSLFIEVVSMPLMGDANNDEQVTGADLIAVQANFGATGPADGLLFGDANDDGMVTGADLIAVQQNYGNVATAAVPEPTSVCLLA